MDLTLKTTVLYVKRYNVALFTPLCFWLTCTNIQAIETSSKISWTQSQWIKSPKNSL